MRTTKCVERILSVTEMLDSPNAPSILDSLPKQPELRTDLAGQVHGQLAVVFIDLDNFKSVNDINGHQAGDTCLQKVAEVITECVTGKGKLYRYGGDEFVVILHNADVDEAAATGERIRRRLEVANPGGDVPGTASIGVASSDQFDLHDSTKLLEAADKAGYESKNSGKNHVTKWKDGAEPPPPRIDLKQRIRRLVELAEFGVHHIQNNKQKLSVDQLAPTEKKWRDDVLEALAEAGAFASEVSSIRVLGIVPTQITKIGPDRKLRNETAERVIRLRRIIEDIEKRQPRR